MLKVYFSCVSSLVRRTHVCARVQKTWRPSLKAARNVQARDMQGSSEKMDLIASSRKYKGSTYTSARMSPSAASALTLKIKSCDKKMRQCGIILLATKVVTNNLVVGGHAMTRYFHFDIYGSGDPQTRTGR